MKKISHLVLFFFISISVTGCSIQKAQIAAKAQKSMIGMSKEEVLRCMGAAASTQNEGNTEVWKYHSGGDTYTSINAFSDNQYTYGNVSSRRYSCEVNIVFVNGSVSNVNYSGRTGGLFTRGSQCSYAVNNCVR